MTDPAAIDKTEQKARSIAADLIRSHSEGVEFLSVVEMLSDYEIADDADDTLAHRVSDLIDAATVTVTWPDEAPDGR